MHRVAQELLGLQKYIAAQTFAGSSDTLSSFGGSQVSTKKILENEPSIIRNSMFSGSKRSNSIHSVQNEDSFLRSSNTFSGVSSVSKTKEFIFEEEDQNKKK